MDNDDWVIVDSTSIHEQSKTKPSMIQTYTKRGHQVWKLYKKALLAYKIYRIARLCVAIYLFCHTHHIIT